jgi:hypothetical protein
VEDVWRRAAEADFEDDHEESPKQRPLRRQGLYDYARREIDPANTLLGNRWLCRNQWRVCGFTQRHGQKLAIDPGRYLWMKTLIGGKFGGVPG